jgi:hypothetical protein
MSDLTWLALNGYVDQLLDPLPRCTARRREMREELLGHLVGIFEEEQAQTGNEAAALQQTLARFGAADPLQVELSECLTFRERFYSWLIHRKDKIMWRLFLVLGVVAVLVGMGFVMPAIQQMLYVEVMTLSVGLLGLGLVICAAGVWSFVYGVQRFRVRNL